MLRRPRRWVEPGKGGESDSPGVRLVQRAGVSARSGRGEVPAARARRTEVGQRGPVSAQAGAGRGAHPGGAAPGGALGAAVAQLPLLGQRLMTALKPRAPARRSCLAGDSRPVEGLEGRAEGARSSPRMHERAESGAGLSSPQRRRASCPDLLYSASTASPRVPPCLLPCARPVLFSPRAEPSAWAFPNFPNFQAHLASWIPMSRRWSLSILPWGLKLNKQTFLYDTPPSPAPILTNSSKILKSTPFREFLSLYKAPQPSLHQIQTENTFIITKVHGGRGGGSVRPGLLQYLNSGG